MVLGVYPGVELLGGRVFVQLQRACYTVTFPPVEPEGSLVLYAQQNGVNFNFSPLARKLGCCIRQSALLSAEPTLCGSAAARVQASQTQPVL